MRLMQLKIAICDDEAIIRDTIKNKIYARRPEAAVYEFASGTELLCTELAYDILFLDIEMDGMDGMQTAEQIRERNAPMHIIFLTSHAEFMPEAFKVKAFRFLSKPIEEQQFGEALLGAEKELLKNEKVAVKIQGKTRLLAACDIVCFEAFGDGTYIYTKTEVLSTNKPMKYWADQMGETSFFQVHKSYIVALRHIRSVGQTEVEMQYMKEKVPVSRRKLTQLKKAFFEYIKSNAAYV